MLASPPPQTLVVFGASGDLARRLDEGRWQAFFYVCAPLDVPGRRIPLHERVTTVSHPSDACARALLAP